jgi:hypothetical protein
MSKAPDERLDPNAAEFFRSVNVSLESLTSNGSLLLETTRYDDEVFGNAFVIVRGKHVRVRFVRDRGAVLVELACLGFPDRWHPIQRVLQAIGVPGPPEGTISVGSAADLLIGHLDAIEMRMCTKDTTARLSELEADATRRVLESLQRFKPGQD